jgi:hypothetical protein
MALKEKILSVMGGMHVSGESVSVVSLHRVKRYKYSFAYCESV